MVMKLYNSESRKIEDFVPNNALDVNLYTCGPTVYHFAHIGNLRSYIMEDVLEKTLKYLGYNVKRAMNITDVGHLSSDGDTGEDKMLLGAKREHKTIMQIANEYTEAFKADMEKLHLKWPEFVVPATSCISDYIKIITKLMDTGYAYFSNGNVYFDTSKLSKYFRFGNEDAKNLAVGVRDSVEEDSNKKNKNDFVLWFTKSKFENQALKWDSPWGTGYPGWHIECSAISLKTLGEYLDIHCGGIDNRFPHHTNEIAQTESYTGHKWCNYWFHVEHLTTKNGKMSKSSGEFLTLSLLEEKGYSPEVYKFFCLLSHYRKQLLFSYENLDSAKNMYDKLIAKIEKLDKNDTSKVDDEAYKAFSEKFKSALENDLTTSLAITAIYDVLKSDINDATKIFLLKDFDSVLDIGIEHLLSKKITKDEGKGESISGEILDLVNKRVDAKKIKDFATADSIRNRLKDMGYDVIDTKDGCEIRKNEHCLTKKNNNFEQELTR